MQNVDIIADVHSQFQQFRLLLSLKTWMLIVPNLTLAKLQLAGKGDRLVMYGELPNRNSVVHCFV